MVEHQDAVDQRKRLYDAEVESAEQRMKERLARL